MQFKNPEILYFLFALMLPILVHLFQLNKFKKQEFSNIAFLKQISLQTHKSAQIKKWLLLICRLFMLTAVIFAFAQPYFPATEASKQHRELVIALDNSFSMQAHGKNGSVLVSALQDILAQTPKNKTFSLLTNNQSLWNIDIESAQQEIQNITYSATPFQLKTLQNTISTQLNNQPFDLILVSDGIFKSEPNVLQDNRVYFYQTKPNSTENVAIQEVQINTSNPNFNELTITLEGFGVKDSIVFNLTVSEQNTIYSQNKVVLQQSPEKISLNLPKQTIRGNVSIDTPDLAYDNQFYFNIEAQKQIKIGIIGKKSNLLEKIFPKQTASVEYMHPNQDINAFETVIINEPSDVLSLPIQKIKQAYNQGTQLIYIPNSEVEMAQHNTFLAHFGAVKYSAQQTEKNSITTIHTHHPLYANVFSKTPKQVYNPTTQKNYTISGTLIPILSYANQEIFVGNLNNGIANLYVFAAALNTQESTLLQTPISVPTLYNMAVSTPSNLANNFEVGSNQTLVINTNQTNTTPVHLVSAQHSGIPQQQPIGNKIKLFFTNFPLWVGNYQVTQNDTHLAAVSLNYKRTESDLTLPKADLFNNFVPVNSIEEAWYKHDENRLDTALWKFFILTALLFLIFELLILKFVK